MGPLARKRSSPHLQSKQPLIHPHELSWEKWKLSTTNIFDTHVGIKRLSRAEEVSRKIESIAMDARLCVFHFAAELANAASIMASNPQILASDLFGTPRYLMRRFL